VAGQRVEWMDARVVLWGESNACVDGHTHTHAHTHAHTHTHTHTELLPAGDVGGDLGLLLLAKAVDEHLFDGDTHTQTHTQDAHTRTKGTSEGIHTRGS
jgi:hypothetical protein